MLRRLSISATILIPNALIQLTVCLVLCLAFLFHHTYIKPFRNNISNLAEGFSLSLLCGVAAINLMKSCFLYTDAKPKGPQEEIMEFLQLVEIMSVVLLIIVIVCFEVGYAVSKCLTQGLFHPSRDRDATSQDEGETTGDTGAGIELECRTPDHENPAQTSAERTLMQQCL